MRYWNVRYLGGNTGDWTSVEARTDKIAARTYALGRAAELFLVAGSVTVQVQEMVTNAPITQYKVVYKIECEVIENHDLAYS